MQRAEVQESARITESDAPVFAIFAAKPVLYAFIPATTLAPTDVEPDRGVGEGGGEGGGGGGREGGGEEGEGGGRGVRPTAGWYPVVVEVVDLVPGSIPERVQYANMEDWRMDCPWLVLPVKRSASLFTTAP